MFTQRLLTSLFFVPFILGSLVWGSTLYLAGLACVLVIIAAYEWVKLIPLKPICNAFYIPLILGALVLCLYWPTPWLITGLAGWCIFFFAVLTYPDSMRWWGYSSITSALGVLFLPLWIVSLKEIISFSQGSYYLLTLIFMIWAADVGAYLVGRLIGQHKLLVNVSPGKTIEGALGGLILAGLVVLACVYGFNLRAVSTIPMILGVILWVPVSILGDLFFSMLKRRVGLKDTGQILPGHGGILDRFDSQIAAAPFYWAYLTYFAG